MKVYVGVILVLSTVVCQAQQVPPAPQSLTVTITPSDIQELTDLTEFESGVSPRVQRLVRGWINKIITRESQHKPTPPPATQPEPPKE